MDQNSQMQTQPTNRSTTPVLVIDDEESIVDLIKLGLKYEGFEVVAASDGEEGIAAAQRTNPLRNGQILSLSFLTGCSLIWMGWKSVAVFARTLRH